MEARPVFPYNLAIKTFAEMLSMSLADCEKSCKGYPMIRSCRVATVRVLASRFIFSSVLVVCVSGVSFAQEVAAPAGLAPATVQDEGSLTEKAGLFVGFNAMTSIKGSIKNLDQKELFAGMQAAADGIDKDSFLAGYQMFSDIKQRDFGFKIADVQKGMLLAAEGKEIGMSEEEITAMMTAFQSVIQKKQIAKMKVESDKYLAEGAAYAKQLLAGNPKVKALSDGIVYEVLTPGTGASPTAADKVKVDYHGTFIDGEVFDSSVTPPSGGVGAPIELVVGQFVPGFSKTLQAMKVGGKWRVVIPGPQAYGPGGGAGGAIKPNQTLIFELTLVEIVK
ncbi:MAG: FKBP-type peptidyl-prolyl cis-trans isomerase FklB [Mariniblastus sp.]|jgi:FKBP-type peptidyl-prolyl cis-trans isomerase FklB